LGIGAAGFLPNGDDLLFRLGMECLNRLVLASGEYGRSEIDLSIVKIVSVPECGQTEFMFARVGSAVTVSL